jgi:hypothetical protein
MDVPLPASRLALDHKRDLAELMTGMVVWGEGRREQGEGRVAVGSVARSLRPCRGAGG